MLKKEGEAKNKKTGKTVQSIGDDAADIAKVVNKNNGMIFRMILKQIKIGDLKTVALRMNFGEMAANRDMMNKGYDPLHERLTDITTYSSRY